jgi:hypothetical protein
LTKLIPIVNTATTHVMCQSEGGDGECFVDSAERRHLPRGGREFF